MTFGGQLKARLYGSSAAAPPRRSRLKKAPTLSSSRGTHLATCHFRERCSPAFWSKSSVDRQNRVGAPPRRAPIGTAPPPFAPPWPIHPRTIFSGSGVLASKRSGGRGGSNLDGQIDGQIMVQKHGLPEENRQKCRHFLDSVLDVCFGIRSQKLHQSFYSPLPRKAASACRPEYSGYLRIRTTAEFLLQ